MSDGAGEAVISGCVRGSLEGITQGRIVAPDQAWQPSGGVPSRIGIQTVVKGINMKYATFPIGLVAAVLAFSPASAHMEMCSDMSKMTSMMNGMPDSSKKWEMNRHLAMVNAAMAKDGTRGCKMAMMTMMHGRNMPMMKSGASGRRKTGTVSSTHVH